MIKLRHLLAALAVSTAPALAQGAEEDAPLSAIDWMLEIEPEAALPSGVSLERPVTQSAAAPSVDALPLNDGNGGGTGVLAPATTGLPVSLWRGATLEGLKEGFAALPPESMPAVRDIRKRLLLAEASAPMGGSEAEFLALRAQELRALGSVVEAVALIEEAGDLIASDPALFAAYTDLTLLSGRETFACARLKGEAALNAELAFTIFCLARNSDWNAAAVTLRSAQVLGDVSPPMVNLLEQFLEPEFADEGAETLDGMEATPLVFRLREAIGAPLSTADLPRAFSVTDLRPDMGLRAQLAAAERLVRTGAIDPGVLWSLYLTGVPAASGGVWERVDAVQELESAAANGGNTEAALANARQAMATAGLTFALAEMLPVSLTNEPYAVDLALLSRSYEKAAVNAGALAKAIAYGDTSSISGRTALEDALVDAFASAPAPVSTTGALGTDILRALSDVERARQGDLSGLRRGLSDLRAVGLEDTARRTALYLLLAP